MESARPASHIAIEWARQGDVLRVLSLLKRSAPVLARTAAAALGLLLLLAIPLWIWSISVVRSMDVATTGEMATRDLVELGIQIGLPSILIGAVVALTTLGALTHLLYDIHHGHRARVLRSMWDGLRSAPRLARSVVPAVVAVVSLLAFGPAIWLFGIAVLLFTPVARRTALRDLWPDGSLIRTLAIPFAPAASVALSLSLVPVVGTLERAGARASFRRSRALARDQRRRLTTGLVLLTTIGLGVAWSVSAMVDALDLGTHAWGLIRGMLQLTIVATGTSLGIIAFGEAGGSAAASPPPARPRTIGGAGMALLLLVALMPFTPFGPARTAEAAVPGSTFMVNDLGDTDDASPGDFECADARGACTLRAAITEANLSSDDSIRFDVTGTITLGSTLRLERPMVIDGVGEEVVISGGDAVRIFFVGMEILGGGYGTLRNLTLADGVDGGLGGAAIYNSGTSRGLVLDRLTIRGNSTSAGALFGGAVVNTSAMTITNSTFSGNVADITTDGSDLANVFSGALTVDNTTFTGSDGSSAVSNSGGPTVVRNSIISAPRFSCVGTITGAGNVSTDAGSTCPGTTATPGELALAALADNGGDTATARLGPSSAAIDAGEASSCLATDQRGNTRTGPGCDAGSYDFDPSTTTTLDVDPAVSLFGRTVTLIATVDADEEPPVPTGRVEFYDGATSLGSVALVAGTAELEVSTLRTGDHSLTATYLPDSGFATSDSTAKSLTIQTNTPTVVLEVSAPTSTSGETVTLTATVTGTSAGTPTGTITFEDGTTTLDTKPLAAGTATLQLSTLGPGPHDLVAAYRGDSNYAAADSDAVDHDVVAPSTVSLTPPASPTVFGNRAAFIVDVTPASGAPTPTGDVTLEVAGASIATAALDGSGSASIDVATLGAGTPSITARYAGDSYNGAADSPSQTHTVTPAATSTVLVVTPTGSSVFGTQRTLEATVTAPDSAATPAGSITFHDGANALATMNLFEGVASLPNTSLLAGDHTLRVVYNPTPDFVDSESTTVDHEVTRATTSISLTTSKSTSVFGEPVTLEATVTTTDSPRRAVGTVTFRDGTTVLGSAPLDGARKARLTAPAAAVGARTLTATYNGTPDIAGSTSAGVRHEVAAASVDVTIDAGTTSSTFGEDVVVEITVTPLGPGAGTPTGAAVLRDGTTVVDSRPLDASGEVSFTLTGLSVGFHDLRIDYAGDTSFGSGFATTRHQITADQPAMSITTSDPTIEFTETVTFRAVVSGTAGETPTGSVTFTAGSVELAVVTLDGAGVAVFTTAALPSGRYFVRADYSGDGGFDPAGAAVRQTVDRAGTSTALTITPPTPSVTDIITLRAVVTGTTSTATPTGRVEFLDNGVRIATRTLDANGVASWSQPFTRAFHTIEVRFIGTPGWSPSTARESDFVPGRGSGSMTVTGSPTSVVAGDDVTWTATISTPATGPDPTGSIMFFSGFDGLGTAPIVGGVARLTVPSPLVLGPWDVHASYVGDTNYGQIPRSTTGTVQVQPAGSVIDIVVPGSAYALDDVAVSARVVDADGAPLAGRVRFSVDDPGVSPLTARLDGTGWASTTLTRIPAGDAEITATFIPDAGSTYASSSTSKTLASRLRPAGVRLTVPSSGVVGASIPVEVGVADLTGSGPTPTGSVVVTTSEGSTCTTTVAAGRCRIVLGTAGIVRVNATYLGDIRYGLDDANPLSVSVALAQPTLVAWTSSGTWATGDPVTITWSLTGPTSGEVIVRTPFGEVCRQPAKSIDSCTVAFPFSTRGQVIPVDVRYAGTNTWAEAFATVTKEVVGCFQLTRSVSPPGAGTLTGPATGNCNQGTGFLAGTPVSFSVRPNDPYVLSRWFENGSSAPAYAFVVGDNTRSVTAILEIACVELLTAAAPQVDFGGPPSALGTIALTPTPNCPTRSRTTTFDAARGANSSWYIRGTAVTLDAQASRPGDDEFKGWLIDGALRRSADTELVKLLTEDFQIEARFGVRCVRPTVSASTGGSAVLFTSENCVDVLGFGWEKGSRIGVTVKPDAYHWIESYGSTSPTQTIPRRIRYPDTYVDVFGANAFWTAVDDLRVDLTFETCRELTLAPTGPGTIDVVTAPNCPTRLDVFGNHYVPGTEVELRAVPDARSSRPARRRLSNGDWDDYIRYIVPEFLRWDDVDTAGLWDRSTLSIDPVRSSVRMDDDRTAGATFFDHGECQGLTLRVEPPGAATTSVDLDYGPGDCPEGEAELINGDYATFSAVPTAGNPLVGWLVRTNESQESIERLVWNDVPGTPIEEWTIATAWVCTAVIPELTLIAPDGSVETGPAPPNADFLRADADGDCPLWENAYTVGSQLSMAALAPPEGYRFVGWEGDVGDGADPSGVTSEIIDIEFGLDGMRFREHPDGQDPGPWIQTSRTDAITVRAVYQVVCATLTIEFLANYTTIGPQQNCPGTYPTAAMTASTTTTTGVFGGLGNFGGLRGFTPTSYHFIAGTPVLLDARPKDDHDFVGWIASVGVPEGALIQGSAVRQALLDAGLTDVAELVSGMDNPAMLTIDHDMSIRPGYDQHSLGKRIGDDLAVLGKKAIGFMASFAVGAFEAASGIAYARLILTIGSALVEAIDPDATDVLDALRGAQESYDVLGMSLSCTAEWSRGTPRPVKENPLLAMGASPGATDAGTPPPSGGTSDVHMLKTSKGTIKAVKNELKTAIDNVRINTLRNVQQGTAITTWAGTVTKRAALLTKFSKGLGTAASFGTTIFLQVSEGPGIVWEDTAAEAWATGGDEFLGCIQRELSEASDGHIPMPNT